MLCLAKPDEKQLILSWNENAVIWLYADIVINIARFWI